MSSKLSDLSGPFYPAPIYSCIFSYFNSTFKINNFIYLPEIWNGAVVCLQKDDSNLNKKCVCVCKSERGEMIFHFVWMKRKSDNISSTKGHTQFLCVCGEEKNSTICLTEIEKRIKRIHLYWCVDLNWYVEEFVTRVKRFFI